jgi:hypothetical protein
VANDHQVLGALSRYEDEIAEQCKEQREATVARVLEVFDMARRHLGDDGARFLWNEMALERKGRGRPLRSKISFADAWLLNVYDRLAAECTKTMRKALPRLVAAHVKEHWPGDYRAAVDSIERRLRRLLKSRAKKA